MWTENRRPLRSWVEEKLATSNTHATLRAACERFGITGEDVDGSKRERAAVATRGMTDRQIAAAAERMAVEYRDPRMQEAALAVLESDAPPITEITRSKSRGASTTQTSPGNGRSSSSFASSGPLMSWASPSRG
jgi:hypothetical protein